MLLLARGDRFNANFFYHSGVDIDNSFFIKDGEERTLLVSRMNKEYAEEKFIGEVIAFEKDPLKEIEKLSRGRKIETDFRGISAYFFSKICSFAKPVDVSEQLAKARVRKSAGELLLMRQAARAGKAIIELGKDSFGKTEQQLSSRLYSETYREGLRPAFRPIVASGRNSSFPHCEPTDEKISGLCLVDYGVSSRRYYSDLTRVFFEKRDAKKEKIYAQLKRILAQIVDEIPNLSVGSDIAHLAEKLYRKERLPFPPHSIGHGIGLEVHELPSLSKKSKDPLEGATFTLEPSVYYSGEFGLRYEEVIHYNGKKAQVL
ncbi:MAG: M24 family metallopeptidase [Candidatus Micrarchaeota archaeon]